MAVLSSQGSSKMIERHNYPPPIHINFVIRGKVQRGLNEPVHFRLRVEFRAQIDMQMLTQTAPHITT